MYVGGCVFILYFYSRSIKPGNKDPLIIISLIKLGQLQSQLQPQLQPWQCWLRQHSGNAQQRQRSVSGSAAALAAAVALAVLAVEAQRQRTAVAAQH